ncbi:SRPBCC family protein [Planosporangium sp. 12N6]|uniref:SRPBCC family protein n=1 Tax=Planosporangium spinosum TaxID=3402278 RepID=UPI003CF8BF70
MVIGTTHLEITATVPGPAAAVRDWFCDITNLTHVHPLVVGVRRQRQTVESGTTVTDYLVTDRMAVAGRRVRFTYRVRVSAPAQGPVRMLARQFPMIRLDNELSFTPADGGTLIRERLTVHAPRPLLRFVAAEAERAHRRMYTAMGGLFGSDPA